MILQDELSIHCPYCGEQQWILIDPSVESQKYIEDCQVCCQPMEIRAICIPGLEPEVQVAHQDEG